MTRWDGLTILAGLTLAGGVACIYWPAGVIVLGIEAGLLGLLMDLKGRGTGRRPR